MVSYYWLIIVGVLCFIAGFAVMLGIVYETGKIGAKIEEAARRAGPWIGPPR